jgi:hypothetical protein
MKRSSCSSVAVLFAAAAVSFAGIARAGDHLILSEIVANEVGSTFDGEWYEIYNPTNAAIDLSNFKIGDEETKLGTGTTEGMFQFPAGASIAPGQLQVVASYASRFKSLYGFAPNYEVGNTAPATGDPAWVDDAAVPNMSVYNAWDPDGAKLNMSNTNDQSLILDGSDNIVDQASWVDSTFYFNPSLPTAADGQSWERLNLDIDTNTAADWRLTPAAPAGATWTTKSTPGALPAIVASNWISDGDGAWIIGANWQDGVVPTGAGTIAVFGNAITASRSVTLLEDATVGTLRFDADHSYTIDGSANLILNAGTGVAAIQVARGSHTISAPVTLTSSTNFDVATGGALDVTGTVTSAVAITKTGAGAMTVNRVRATGLGINGGSLKIRHGGTNDSTSVVTSLSIAAGATLDIDNNAIVIDYAAAATTSPLASIAAALHDGRLTSAAVATDTRLGIATADTKTFTTLTTFGGVTLDASAIVARIALLGDADLSGTVDFQDLVILAQNYNTATGGVWTTGDSNYDGAIDFGDLVPLAQNYNGILLSDIPGASSSFAADWALAQTLVPEPTLCVTLLAGAMSVTTRRRRVS